MTWVKSELPLRKMRKLSRPLASEPAEPVGLSGAARSGLVRDVIATIERFVPRSTVLRLRSLSYRWCFAVIPLVTPLCDRPVAMRRPMSRRGTIMIFPWQASDKESRHRVSERNYVSYSVRHTNLMQGPNKSLDADFIGMLIN